MYPFSPFIIQIANLCIEIHGYNDEDFEFLHDLKLIFNHHVVSSDNTAIHRIVVSAANQFNITREATLQWVSPCLGVAGPMTRHRWLFFVKSLARHKKIPRYSGTCDVMCYKDTLRGVDYFIPKNAEWRIEHKAKEHVTHVFSNRTNGLSDGLPSMLMHVIGSQYGCYLLYASCIAVDGDAFLFIGNSGVGKSTLCMELIKKGASYIGDDLVLLYMNEGQAMVGSLLFPIKRYANRQHTHKQKIDIVSQLPHRPPLNVPLKKIYFLQRTESTNAESHIKAMQGDKMLEKMLKLTNKANTNADGRHFVDTISSICSCVPCYYLYYGEYNKINPSFFANNDQK